MAAGTAAVNDRAGPRSAADPTATVLDREMPVGTEEWQAVRVTLSGILG